MKGNTTTEAQNTMLVKGRKENKQIISEHETRWPTLHYELRIIQQSMLFLVLVLHTETY